MNGDGWDAQDIEDLKDLWAQGLSTAEIGRRMGRSKNAVVGKAHRLELEARPSPIRLGYIVSTTDPRVRILPAGKNTLPALPSSFQPKIIAASTGRPRSTTDEQERRILFFAEASEVQCAALAGVSRHVVARVREGQRRDPQAAPLLPSVVADKQREADAAAERATQAAQRLTERMTPPATPQRTHFAPPPPATASCHWPLGSPGTKSFSYCGSTEVVSGKPYCAEHCAVAYIQRRPGTELMAAE